MAKETSLTPEKRTAILEALRKAMPLSYACDLTGVPRQTCYDEMKRNVLWRTQVACARAEAIRGLVVMTGKQGGAWKLLKNLGKEEFKEHVEVSQTEKYKYEIDSGEGEKDEFTGY